MASIARCRELRRRATQAERILWSLLRGKQTGSKWRRQHAIGRYVLDFFCPAESLALEIEGASHRSDEAFLRDQERDRWLGGIGIRVLRVTHEEVMRDARAVVRRVCLNIPHPASPVGPVGGGA